jgi:predicted secreted protein
MTLTAAVAVYFILWWVVLFAILPFGIRSQHEEKEMAPGTDPGAPVRHGLLMKAVATTIVSAVIFGVGYSLFASGLVRLESFPMPFSLPR